MKREIETGRFLAKTDTGKEYIIVQYQEYIDATHLTSSRREEIAGLKRLATSTGLDVTYIDPKTFKIVSTGEIVRKV